jgi:predicted metal-dependent enzyme (double-stranded beta helix superfamily)
MNNYSLESFITECRDTINSGDCPADCVEAIIPSMYKLLTGDTSFLKPEHYVTDSDHYSRNAIYIADNGNLSLYSIAWLPGQWTPIHDHGTWGVVGVFEGILEERNFIRTDPGSQKQGDPDRGITLARGGSMWLTPGTVTSFVPNPDHIHITGNPDAEERVLSLHLYGRAMSGFHIYDREQESRRWVNVAHNES